MEAPLFNWLNKRTAGVLMHPSSLPNQYVIGNFGQSAKSFVDMMSAAGMTYWQVLPLGPTGYGDSPYQSYSSHAINPYLIDIDALISKGWVSDFEARELKCYKVDSVDYEKLRIHHANLRKIAITKSLKEKSLQKDFAKFKDTNKWVSDYALFMALKSQNNGDFWLSWKKEHRNYDEAIKCKHSQQVIDEIELICFEQFVLYSQWMELKAYANERGIQVIGDIPIYVSPDSVDVWAHKEVFQVTKTGKMTKLAGVPPDYFNSDGQFWGNPLYNWKYLKETNYSWWIDRLSHTASLFDVVRFDHFRALDAFWSIPANASSAKEGKWVPGPGIDFFKAIKKGVPSIKMILEDLGEITQGVIDLKDGTGCPGLAVLQFAFGGESDNFYLPHNVSENTVIYTGTHDNDTSRGWYESTDEKSRDHFRRYLRVSGDEACWDLIRTAYQSTAGICIIPTQDLLSLDSQSRMNTPGLATGNWSWRMTGQQMFEIQQNSVEYLRYLGDLYGRL